MDLYYVWEITESQEEWQPSDSRPRGRTSKRWMYSTEGKLRWWTRRNGRKTKDDIAEDRTVEGVGLKLVGGDAPAWYWTESTAKQYIYLLVNLYWLSLRKFFVTIQYSKYICIMHSGRLWSQIKGVGSHWTCLLFVCCRWLERLGVFLVGVWRCPMCWTLIAAGNSFRIV